MTNQFVAIRRPGPRITFTAAGLSGTGTSQASAARMSHRQFAFWIAAAVAIRRFVRLFALGLHGSAFRTRIVGMLCVNSYPKDYIDECRSGMEAQLRPYK